MRFHTSSNRPWWCSGVPSLTTCAKACSPHQATHPLSDIHVPFRRLVQRQPSVDDRIVETACNKCTSFLAPISQLSPTAIGLHTVLYCQPPKLPTAGLTRSESPGRSLSAARKHGARGLALSCKRARRLCRQQAGARAAAGPCCPGPRGHCAAPQVFSAGGQPMCPRTLDSLQRAVSFGSQYAVIVLLVCLPAHKSEDTRMPGERERGWASSLIESVTEY